MLHRVNRVLWSRPDFSLQLIRQAVKSDNLDLAKKYATQFVSDQHNGYPREYLYRFEVGFQKLFEEKEWDVLAILKPPTQKPKLWTSCILKEYYLTHNKQDHTNQVSTQHDYTADWDELVKYLPKFYDVGPVLGCLVENGQTELALKLLTPNNMFYSQPTFRHGGCLFYPVWSAILTGIYTKNWEFLELARTIMTKQCDKDENLASLWYDKLHDFDEADEEQAMHYLKVFYTDEILVANGCYQVMSPSNQLSTIWGDAVGTRVLNALMHKEVQFLEGAAVALERGGVQRKVLEKVAVTTLLDSLDGENEQLVEEYLPRFFVVL